MSENPTCQIYLITPPSIGDIQAFSRILQTTLAAAPIACLQIRIKDRAPEDIINLATEIVPICHAHETLVIMNDDPHLVAPCQADGVHLGQSDMDIKNAQQLLEDDAIIGITCHNSTSLAIEAAMSDADYVAFGSFFESATKPEARPADLEILQWWRHTTIIPSVAIGGITVDNAEAIIKAGADYIALSSGVWDYAKGPAEAVKRLSAQCHAHSF
ncbi:MAG TPA: thiamine phosphate synthase [Hellea balneolensis]|uniref:Thiamine-phosphate synthase n=1 Tax=Hellea balneolensis TaxID=287478 RepID=A0A7C5M0G0_9PROT|nr:thiamine phosphate synthase [Hellea balneolensis]